MHGAVLIAQEKGYFAAEGLTAELVFFEAAQPVSVAVVSGAIDFGSASFTAGFYNLSGQGALRIIAAGSREVPGFPGQVYVVSNRAYAAGLTSFRDFPGHSVAVTTVGSANHYSLGLLAEKYGLDLKSIRVLPLQSVSNVLSAIKGGQADVAVLNATTAVPAIRRGDVKLIGFVGDETPWQFAAVFTGTRTANERRDTVERFLRAYRKATRDYHEAFVGEDGKRRDGPAAPEVLAIFARQFRQSAEEIKLGISYVDADARLDVSDVLHQIAWFRSQNMSRGQISGEDLIDKRYVVALPER